MKQHGENPQKNVIAIIPARYSSTRLPGKMLADIAGKPLIVRTYEQAKKARTISRVIVAADDDRIVEAIRSAGGEAVMTSAAHASGSDRVAEVARTLPDGSIVVNIQGDEPLISPETIDRTVSALIEDDSAQMATACEPINSKGELVNGNVVKVVVSETGNAVYFSRSPMPFPREASLRWFGDPGRALDEEPELLSLFRKHTGLYVYRREYLLEYTALPQTRLEQIEMLEQLRALENGARIKVVASAAPSIGVDTPEDLERVRAILLKDEIRFRKAVFEDIPRVASVHIASWRESFAHIAPEDFLSNMSLEKRTERLADRFHREPYTMFIAETPNDEITGFLDFGPPVLDTGHDSQVYSFYFRRSFQRLGLGTRLFRHAVDEMRRAGHRSLCLDSLAVSPYRRFYEKMGGQIIGRDAHMLGNEEFETVIYGWEDIDSI